MIANTYVVKPFGISEVKVIALKGEPGGPTQEQVNTAVEEYMDDHPEAQIPDGAVTTEKLASTPWHRMPTTSSPRPMYPTPSLTFSARPLQE